MSILLTATFGTRREADMTVERLVEEFDVGRATISVSPADEANGASEPTGSGDAALDEAVAVTAEVEDEAAAETVRSVFGEFDTEGVVEIDRTLD